MNATSMLRNVLPFERSNTFLNTLTTATIVPFLKLSALEEAPENPENNWDDLLI